MERTNNLRVAGTALLPSPDELLSQIPLSLKAARCVARARHEIEALLNGRDDRLLVVVGPCSIHDPALALEYAEGLRKVRDRLAGSLMICMRGYFEKPRTTVGWKGLINDPYMDGSCDVAYGLKLARKLLLDLAELGLPTAQEALDPVSPQYLMDLISWSAIGARTTESQTHREMASGLSMPVGFKNGTDGGLEVVVNAMKSAAEPHSFVGIDGSGRAAVVRTTGNPHTHAVLRGGSSGPNYDAVHVTQASAKLESSGLNARVLVDCSHGNSKKDHRNQPLVAGNVAEQLEAGSRNILGVMIESHLVEGRQDIIPGKPLVHGQSVTDACIDFPTTEATLERLAKGVETARRVNGDRPTPIVNISEWPRG